MCSWLVHNSLQRIVREMDFLHHCRQRILCARLFSTCLKTTKPILHNISNSHLLNWHLKHCPNATLSAKPANINHINMWKCALFIGLWLRKYTYSRTYICKISKYHIIPPFLPLLLHPNICTTWHSWRWKKQMGAGGHQLLPVSQVTIVTSRLKPHVCIPRSCSGSARSCPFTSTPTDELGAKHDVITPIWLRTSHRTGKWSAVSCACLPRQGYSNKGSWPT